MSQHDDQQPQQWNQQGPPPGYPQQQWAAQPEPKKKRHWVRNSLLGFVALVIVGSALSSMGGGSDGTATVAEGGSAGAQEKAPKKAKKIAGIGTPTKDGKFQFTVTDVETGKTHVGDSTFGSDAQGEYVIVSVTVKNIGDEAQTLDASSQEAYDGAGHKFSADGSAGIDLDAKTFLNDINPGNQVSGRVVFDVPKGTKLERLELHDSPFSGGVKVAI